MKILVVDDNEQNVYQLQVLLGAQGYAIESAVNGAVALEKARQSPPALVITDILMPVMDGYSLCREWMLDERLKAIPLIYYTATYTDERDRKFALGLGAAGFIVKPEEPGVLLQTIRTLVAESAHGRPPAATKELPGDVDYLKEYNEALIRKLEHKMRELEQANRDLERDLAERKRVEEALRQEQTLFNNLADTVPDHIYFKDRQSRFVRINEAQARRLGLRSPAEAAGKTEVEIFNHEQARQAYADEQRIMATGEPMIGVEEEETWPDGRVSWMSTTKMPLRDAEGRIAGLVGLARDISERKAAERRLREQNEILSHAHEGVMIVSLAHEVVLWNRGAEMMLGWTQAEALGRRPEELLGVHELAASSTLQAAVERDGLWSGELRAETRDGRKLTLECRITLVRDDAGRPRARLNFFADITEKKLLEEKFLHAQRIKSLGMLATGIAHDLNNMLAPIMFAAPLLRDSLSKPQDLKILDTLEQCAGRGAGLVKQILGFAHSTAGDFRPTQMKHLARDIVTMIAETFPKSIQLKQSIPSDLWLVQGNPTQIHQMLLNLCVNARDAMPQGGTLTVAVTNRRLDAAQAGAIPGARPGAWVVLEVADTGTGIAPEVLEHIWTPFYTTKGIGQGTGLGLSTVRGLVASHHGFVALQTAIGQGSTFRIFLPAIESVLSPSPAASPQALPRGNGELILVADDDRAVLEVVTTILRRQNYRVVSCADGLDAFKTFNAHLLEISLAITDVDMPRLSGTALARALLSARPDIRLLVMSGLVHNEKKDGEAPGVRELAHAFLLKPFTSEDLLGAVHRLLAPGRKP